VDHTRLCNCNHVLTNSASSRCIPACLPVCCVNVRCFTAYVRKCHKRRHQWSFDAKKTRTIAYCLSLQTERNSVYCIHFADWLPSGHSMLCPVSRAHAAEPCGHHPARSSASMCHSRVVAIILLELSSRTRTNERCTQCFIQSLRHTNRLLWNTSTIKFTHFAFRCNRFYSCDIDQLVAFRPCSAESALGPWLIHSSIKCIDIDIDSDSDWRQTYYSAENDTAFLEQRWKRRNWGSDKNGKKWMT